MLRHLALCLLVLFGSATTGFAQDDYIEYINPQEYEIGGITVTGTEFADKNLIKIKAGLYVGEKITIPGDDLAKSIKKLWDLRLFTDVQIVITNKIDNTVFLDIKVEERPRFCGISYQGTKKSEEEELQDKINLRCGSILTENNRLTTKSVVENYFIDKGFLNVKVSLFEYDDTLAADNTVKLKIFVDRGKKIKIKKIEFIGNNEVKDRTLRNQMKNTREKVKLDIVQLFKYKQNKGDSFKIRPLKQLGEISPSGFADYADDHVNLNIFKSSRFIEDDYYNDKRAIVAYYNNKGFRDARIVMDTTYQDEEELVVEVQVFEGNRYYFRDISFVGNLKYSDGKLDSILGINAGDVYNKRLLDERLNLNPKGLDVSALYMDDGYLFFQVTPIELLASDDSIDIEVRIYEGPQAIVRKVIISGNTKTNEAVIRRELRVMPGKKFSRSDLIRSQREIAALGYFDPEQLEVIPYPNPVDGTVDIEFKVVEKPSDQLELSAGWGGRQGVVGTFGVSFTNFSLRNMANFKTWNPLPSGDGQKLSIRLQSNGRVYQSYNASFTEPWLGGKKPTSLTLAFFRSRFNDLDSERNVEGSLITTGFSLSLGTRLKWPDDYFVFQPSISFQQYNLSNWPSQSFTFSDGKSNNLSLKLALTRNSLNDPLFPSSGSNLSFSMQATLPYSQLFEGRKLDYEDKSMPDSERYKWLEYHKWRFNAEWYQTLIRSKNPLVLRVSAKMGFLGLYNSDIGLSPFERFELGGDGLSNNVQFFGRDIISLRGYDVITPTDGSPIFNKYTVELRYPFSTNPSATIYGLAFVEGGNYWDNINEYDPFDLNRSFGAGLRVFLPMFGLLGFDYGIGFDDTPADGNNIFSKFGQFKIVLGFEPE